MVAVRVLEGFAVEERRLLRERVQLDKDLGLRRPRRADDRVPRLTVPSDRESAGTRAVAVGCARECARTKRCRRCEDGRKRSVLVTEDLFVRRDPNVACRHARERRDPLRSIADLRPTRAVIVIELGLGLRVVTRLCAGPNFAVWRDPKEREDVALA